MTKCSQVATNSRISEFEKRNSNLMGQSISGGRLEHNENNVGHRLVSTYAWRHMSAT